MAREIQAPNPYDKTLNYTVFLGGAIDMNTGFDWQAQVIRAMADLNNVTFLNPRRSDWDDSWKQSADDPNFREQVTWELKAQEDCDLNLYVLLDESKGPVTMLEIGLFAPTKDCVLCIEEGFYRRGNIDLVAEKYDIPIYHDLDEMIADLHTLLEGKV